MSARHRNRGNTVRGRLIAVAAALWLCVGLQPCAMAADFDCPQCPSGQRAPMPQVHVPEVQDHGGHGHQGKNREQIDCDGTDGSCCEASVTVGDGRNHPDKTKARKNGDGGDFELAPPPAPFAPGVVRPGPPGRSQAPPGSAPPAGPLYLLNCVFLD